MSDKPAIRPDAAVGDQLAAVACDILGAALAGLDDPEKSDAVAVHDYRKAMKRWRALLRLLEPFIGPDYERFRIEARDLARGLGGARDAQGALDALDDLKDPESTLPPKALTTIRGRIEEIRQAAEAMTLTEAMRGQLRAHATTATLAVGTWPLDRAGFSEVAAQLAAGYGRARRAVPSDWLQADGEELHELRQRVVVHRYQMELVEPLWPRLGKLWIAEAQRLRERLGAHHDLSTLARLTAPRQPLARWRSRLAPLIVDREAAHVAAASRLAGRLFAEKSKAFRLRFEALWATRGGTAD